MDNAELKKAKQHLGKKTAEFKKIFGRSVRMRHMDTGSCNACELELMNLTSPIYDINRLGIDFVASPRHADILMVTGPVSINLLPALITTYEAMPEPKYVAAVGVCPISCGVYAGGYGIVGPLNKHLKVDSFIPGCPPHPVAIIHGISVAIDSLKTRIEKGVVKE